MGAKKLLLEKRPNMFWSSCATYTINLMLQGIGNLPRFVKVLDKSKSFTIFVYGHTRTLDCMRHFSSGKEIIRPGVTRFASAFLTLESLLDKKDQLRKMVVDSRWESLREVKSKKGKEATTMIMSMAFWKDVKLCLNVFEPLVKVLRLVDGDVKPSMGFVYGEIVKAKKEMKEVYGNVESRYKDVIDVVEKKMKDRLDSPLHLAAYLLNPYYSYADTNILDDGTVTEGFINCVETFYHGDDSKQDQAVNMDLRRFQNREGSFSKKLARTCQNFDYNAGMCSDSVCVPVYAICILNFEACHFLGFLNSFSLLLFLASWWRLYGNEVPTLQRMAMRILSLTSGASACERNWSTFENVSLLTF
jgi:hypothetical protein